MDKIQVTVNGKEYIFHSSDQAPFPDTETLRETLHNRVPGIELKKNCDRGLCGNCTILLNGKPVSACMTLTASCEGANIVTWEGLSREELRLYEIFKKSEVFSRHAAYISIRGLVMICAAQFREKNAPERDDFAEALRGNYGSCLDIDTILDLVDKYKETFSADQMDSRTIHEENGSSLGDFGKGGAK